MTSGAKRIPVEREGVSPSSSKFYVRAKAKGGERLVFRVHGNTKLKKLKVAYCDRKMLDRHKTVFRFNGVTINNEHSPDELQIKPWSTIHVTDGRKYCHLCKNKEMN